MTDSEMTLERLRTAADRGDTVREMIDIIKAGTGTEITTFGVMSIFIKAFSVSLADIRELAGAKCLGGAVYEDDAVEAIIAPAIARARFGTTGFRH